MRVVIDTNVAVVANGKSKQASASCVQACIEQLLHVRRGTNRLLVDDGWRIINEYRANLRSAGQPGVGDAFLKWVLTNWANPARCELIPLTPRRDAVEDFEEFPADVLLREFDPADRKFVAVALAAGGAVSIFQAVDSGWWYFRFRLQSHGARVEFLCEADILRVLGISAQNTPS